MHKILKVAALVAVLIASIYLDMYLWHEWIDIEGRSWIDVSNYFALAFGTSVWFIGLVMALAHTLVEE